jgi:cation diffusion facilitator CzcD-associated flavoprotein CzcO
MATKEVTSTQDVVVVGAGFAGMYLLHRLRSLGFNVQVFDKAAGVGGTWYWNRYPGARCDVRSLDYSYSFDPELEQEWEWTEKYATQPEILKYANHVAERYNLWPNMKFETAITSAVFDDARGRWTVTTDKGDVIDTQHFVLAVGTLSTPKLPEIPGIETYKGPKYQTSLWPHEGVDFTGKRVAVIGTGSSAIQSIPLIAKQAKQLTVFQRTPNFSGPAGNRKLQDKEVNDVKTNYREYRQRAKVSANGIPFDFTPIPTFSVPAEEQQKILNNAWDTADFMRMIASFEDVLLDKKANDVVSDFFREKIRTIVKDPEIAEALCPYDHPIGTKRPCVDTDYYATYNLDHVRLVNLRKTPITEITSVGINTTDEQFEFDAIVFATGFDAMTGSILKIDIRGKNGTKLADQWKDGPTTYLGLAIANFPNLYTVTGPQSPSVLSNMMVSIEQHVDWLTDLFVTMRDKGRSVIEATQQAQDEWILHSSEVGNMSLYPLANSWYMGANVPGKPRVFLPYLGGVGPYREICDNVAAQDYKGFVFA